MISLRIAHAPSTATDHVTRLGSIHGPWRRESVAGWCVRAAVLPPYPLFNDIDSILETRFDSFLAQPFTFQGPRRARDEIKWQTRRFLD